MTVNVALFDSLEAAAADAAGALDREAQPRLFDRLDWFRLVERHCPPAGKLRVVRARGGGGGAWLFLAVDHPRAEDYACWYSLRVGPIGAADDDVMTALAAALRDGGLAVLNLEPVENPEPLRRGLEAAGWRTNVEPATVSWRIVTEGQDFDAYWSGRPGRLRSTAKRRARAAGLDIAVYDRFDEAAWAGYEAVYRASWKPEEGSFAFLRALASQEGEAGTLRLGVARKDGRPVAAQLWTVENGEAIIHKLAYAEDARELSPGTVLGMEMFRYVLDRDRVRLIDYGNGDEPYKADWMAERRILWRLKAYNPRTLRGLAGSVRSAVASLAAGRRSR